MNERSGNRRWRSIGKYCLLGVASWLLLTDALPAEQPLEVNGRSFMPGEIIYEEDFEDEQAYWVEGNERNVWIEEGRLILDANHPENRVLTVFIDREFSGELYFEYEAEILASDTAPGYPAPRDVNNINTFLYHADPQGRDLRTTRHERADGAYSHYHSMNGYIVTFVNGHLWQRQQHERDPEFSVTVEKNTGRIRLRENPGFVLGSETFGERSEHGRIYRQQFIFAGDTLYYFIDDRFQLSFEPSPPRRFESGYVAFRTFGTKIAIDNFRVRKVGVADEGNDARPRPE